MLKQIEVNWADENFKRVRRRLWTGTDISDIACPIWGGAYSVLLQKRGYEKPVTRPMQDGLDLEPIAFEDIKAILLAGFYVDGEFFKAVRVWQPRTVFYRNGLGANPDIMVELTTGEIILIELKIVQNITDWRLYDTPERFGRITKAYQQLNHYMYIMGIRRGLVAILNLEYLKWHFSKHKVSLDLADTNIKKAKGALKMLGANKHKKVEELLAESLANMDLATLKDNLKKVNFGFKRQETIKGLTKDVYDYPVEGGKKTVFIEDNESNQAMLDVLATVKHTIESALEKQAKIEAYLLSRVNGNLKKGISVDLSLTKSSETFDFADLKKQGFEEQLKKSDFKGFFKQGSGSFKVVIGGAQK